MCRHTVFGSATLRKGEAKEGMREALSFKVEKKRMVPDNREIAGIGKGMGGAFEKGSRNCAAHLSDGTWSSDEGC